MMSFGKTMSLDTTYKIGTGLGITGWNDATQKNEWVLFYFFVN